MSKLNNKNKKMNKNFLNNQNYILGERDKNFLKNLAYEDKIYLGDGIFKSLDGYILSKLNNNFFVLDLSNILIKRKVNKILNFMNQFIISFIMIFFILFLITSIVNAFNINLRFIGYFLSDLFELIPRFLQIPIIIIFGILIIILLMNTIFSKMFRNGFYKKEYIVFKDKNLGYFKIVDPIIKNKKIGE